MASAIQHIGGDERRNMMNSRHCMLSVSICRSVLLHSRVAVHSVPFLQTMPSRAKQQV